MKQHCVNMVSFLCCSEPQYRDVADELGLQLTSHRDLVEYIMHEIYSALRYMHERGFVHIDVRASNTGVNSRGEVKLVGVLAEFNKKNNNKKTF